MKLLIVESPAKAKTIGQYLGGEYTVRASVGHIRDLPKSNKNAIDIPGGFIPHYEISPGKEPVVAELRRLAKKADEVILATDPDREGEAIAWHIAQVLDLGNSKLKRVTYHEITKEAIKAALDEPRAIDQRLRAAQEARRVLDRLFGYDLSQLVWQKLRYGLSAGRVQSPALRILVEREQEIRAFKPEKFWVISADFAARSADTATIPFVCAVEPKTEAEAEKIVAGARAAAWQVGAVEQGEMERRARAPFTTSTLQQAASSRLGYSPAQTMRLAQKLYEAGHISYMRTDSVNLSASALQEIGQVITEKFGPNYHRRQTYATKSKNAQEAHEAIRPTHPNVGRAGQSGPEQKLYELIWRRAVASQMAPAKLLKTKIVANAGGKDNPSAEGLSLPDFLAHGSVIAFDGWLKADPAARGEENELPKLTTGEPLTLKKIESVGKETAPPPRYSEAGLVKELEKRGIGRPSTYAPIIKTILDRGYVTKENRSLRPTETGEVVSNFLSEHFAAYVSDDFTREMEDDLDEIAEGKRAYAKTLSDFYGPFTRAVQSKKKMPKISDLGPAPAGTKCPECGGAMMVKLGRAGKFLSCARWPDCPGARTIDGAVMEKPKELGQNCPECAEGKLVEREGRYGKFVACSRYPKCRFVKNDPEQNRGATTGVKCPACKTGEMTEKRGRYGVFYGCSNYPKCKNLIKTKPTGALCQMCGALMMVGTKTIPDRCSNKACPNHNPHKLAAAKTKS